MITTVHRALQSNREGFTFAPTSHDSALAVADASDPDGEAFFTSLEFLQVRLRGFVSGRGVRGPLSLQHDAAEVLASARMLSRSRGRAFFRASTRRCLLEATCDFKMAQIETSIGFESGEYGNRSVALRNCDACA